MTIFEPEKRPGASPTPARKSVLILLAMIGLGAVVLMETACKHVRLDSKDQSADPAPEARSAMASSGAGEVVPDQALATSSAAPVSSQPAPLPAAARTNANPPDQAKHLIEISGAINLKGGLTPEQVELWQHHLGELVEQGTAAIPALQQYFQSNQDVRFDSGPAANPLGEPTLRIALLKVMADLPGPANVDLQVKVLRTTSDPDEIALLARQLELQEPNIHRQEIIEAAKAALEKSKNGELPGRDVSPLVKILEQYKDTAAK